MTDEEKATQGDKTEEKEAETQAETQTEEKEAESETETQTEKKPESKTFTQADLDAIVTKRLAKEKARWEKDKDLPELEKLRTANTELASKLKEREITDSFYSTAKEAGAKNTDRLLKIYRGDLEISETGEIENLTDILAKAKTDFPEFFSKGSADGGGGKQAQTLTVDQLVDAEFKKSGRTNAFKL